MREEVIPGVRKKIIFKRKFEKIFLKIKKNIFFQFFFLIESDDYKKFIFCLKLIHLIFFEKYQNKFLIIKKLKLK
jgi:hypothetical protein